MKMQKTSCLSVLVAVAFLGAVGAENGRVYAVEQEAKESALQQSPNEEAKPVEEPKYPQGFINEGPLPEGFPPPSEVGQIVEKCYPLCRTYSAEGSNAFMRCFTYLTKHKHEMTAPVIMDYKRREPSDKPKAIANFNAMDINRMHFVLERPVLDEPKNEGAVVVADMPTMRVLSIAFQGQLSADAREQVEKKLAAEIESRKNITVVGPYRLLGYNSPFVPKDKAFWEIQVPITDVKLDAAK
jgi:SOUL heme-binding protein